VKGDHGLKLRAWVLAVTVAGICYNLLYWNVGINITDEGFWVYGGLLESRGLPYGEYFITPHLTYQFGLFGLLFKLFGAHIFVLRGWWLLLRSMAGAALFGAVAPFAGTAAGLGAAVVLLLAPGPLHKSPEVFALCAQLFGATWFLRRPVARRALLLGLMSGLLFGINGGNTAPITLSLFLAVELAAVVYGRARGVRDVLRRAWRPGALFGLGFLVGNVPLAIYLWPRAARFGKLAVGGGWRELGLNLLSFQWSLVVEKLGSTRLSLGRLSWSWPGYSGPFGVLTIWAVLLLLGWVIVRVVRRGRCRDDLPALVGLIFMALNFPKFFVHADTPHLLQITPPLYYLVLLEVGRPRGERGARRRPLETVAAALLGGFALYHLLFGAYYEGSLRLLRDKKVRVDSEFYPIWDEVEPAGELNRLLTAMRARLRPGEPLCVFPTGALLSVLLDHPNPSVLCNLPATAGPIETVLQYHFDRLAETNTRWMIFVSGSWAESARRFDEIPLFRRLLGEQFVEDARIGRYVLYRRRPPPPEPAPVGG
jgi:hypothetical protein